VNGFFYYIADMIRSKYSKAFKALSVKAVFSSAEGKQAGIPSRMLAYFCAKGLIERVRRGMYRVNALDFGSDFEWEDLAVTALSIPNGVICLISALCYWGLTDEIMREFWIAVPHTTTSPSRENAHIVRMRNISLGRLQRISGRVKTDPRVPARQLL
jgi:predicted transcriptional regulator of viral defense system